MEVPIRVRGEREFGRSRVAGSLWRYAFRTAAIIVRSYRDYWPLQFFGAGIALALTRRRTALGGFFSSTTPAPVSSGRTRGRESAPARASGWRRSTIHIGLIGDMLNRHRIYLEELLYRLRDARPSHRNAAAAHPDSGDVPPLSS